MIHLMIKPTQVPLIRIVVMSMVVDVVRICIGLMPTVMVRKTLAKSTIILSQVLYVVMQR